MRTGLTPREETISKVRLLHLTFITTIFLFVLAIEVSHFGEQPVSAQILVAIQYVTIIDILIGLMMRRKFMEAALEALKRTPEDANALLRWRNANIYSFVHAETVALFGVVLKFLGSSWRLAGPFFVIALLLLLWWTPRPKMLPTKSVPPPAPIG